MVTEYGYLVVAANAMHLAYIERQTNPDKLAYAARLGCDTFRELLQDQAFFNDVARLAEMLKSNRAEVDEIITSKTPSVLEPGEMTAFQDFLIAEKRILIAGGMDKDLVEKLVDEVNNLISQISVEQLNPEMVHAKVEKLRRKACQLADSLRRQHQSENVWKNLWKVTIAVGGCAIVGVNASSVAATVGLSVPAAAVSGAIGSALVSVGTTIVIPELP